jgi:peptidyl-prolyl cis-trans isomerase D
MLTKIREKSQGTLAWVILMLICIPFALWGINNYLDTGGEAPVASVGDKDFYQRDVNKAYEQFSQNLQEMGVDEQSLKKQALQKLIKDEVLLQYVHAEGLITTDNEARDFIKSLPYFQIEGKFSDKQYKSLLSSQRISSDEFVGRIKNALTMEQFQHSIVDSSFATQFDVESFFKIQNQQRDVDYVTVALQALTEKPSTEEVSAYYEQHQDLYRLPEQVSVEYVELLLADIANKVVVTDEKLKAFYDDQKAQYTTPERRKISHILFLSLIHI